MFGRFTLDDLFGFRASVTSTGDHFFVICSVSASVSTPSRISLSAYLARTPDELSHDVHQGCV